ncbi:MAG: hypothetical protein RLZZ206_698 [Cyanobacteriota bacterium]
MCLGLLLVLPLQLATTGWSLLGPEQAAITKLTCCAAIAQAGPAPGFDGRVGVPQWTDLEPAISPLDRPRILASLDAVLTSRSAGPRRRLLQALLLLMAYSGVAMNDPSKGSLLLQLQNSWLRARDDLASSNLVWSNRQQLEQPADLQRLRIDQQVHEALCVLRQAGEAPGSCSRHRGHPPALDPSASLERAESGPFEPGS